MDVSSYLSSQLLGLKTAADYPTYGSRYIGGHNRSNQPFISGYHQIWVQFPNLFGENATESLKWLTATCEGFTPHSTTMNFVDVNGIGQLGSSFPSSRTVNREFTLTFREYRDTPILNIFRIWHGLFDPHTGITSVKGKDLIPVNYKGVIMVGILRPTASTPNAGQAISEEDIEDVLCYEGVFPSVCPEDTVLAADQATNETVQASITFKFDGAPLDKTWGTISTFVDKISEAKYSNVYNFIGQMGSYHETEIPKDQYPVK